MREWVWGVANRRVHGTTHEVVGARWDADQFSLQLLDGRPPYPYVDDELRKVARDAYVSWHGSRYSVPWLYAGKQVWVREHSGEIEVHYGLERIAVHSKAPHKHAVVTQTEHHRGIPLGARTERKILVHIQNTAPVVEIRPLAAYESAAAEVPDDGDRAIANMLEWARPEGSGSASGKLAGTGLQEGAELCGFPHWFDRARNPVL